MIVSRFITDGAKTNGVNKRPFDPTQASLTENKPCILFEAFRDTMWRVRIESGGGEGWGREPIEIALDCRVQITRRHLQIAAFKPHGNADTRPLTIPTREIKLIRTFKGSKIEYESKDNRFFLLSFSLCFFQRKRMEEKLRRFNDQLLNGVYQHFERKIEKERLKKISW